MKTFEVIKFPYMESVPVLHAVKVKRELTIEGYKCILHKEPEFSKTKWSVSMVDVGIRISHSCETQKMAVDLAEQQVKSQIHLMTKAIETAKDNLMKWGFKYPLNV